MSDTDKKGFDILKGFLKLPTVIILVCWSVSMTYGFTKYLNDIEVLSNKVSELQKDVKTNELALKKTETEYKAELQNMKAVIIRLDENLKIIVKWIDKQGG